MIPGPLFSWPQLLLLLAPWVAAALGVSHMALYKHVPNLEALRHLIAEEHQCIPVGDAVSIEEAACTEPLAVTAAAKSRG